jgi:putative ABC transport system permease protein
MMAGSVTTLWSSGVRQAVESLQRHPLRASLSALAMAVAVATMTLVQTGLDELARSARETTARAFGSNAFVVTRLATTNLTRREVADRLARNPPITRSDVRFLDGVAGGRVRYAATAQRSGDITFGGRTFESATITGTQFTLPDVRDIGLGRGRFLTRAEDLGGAQVCILGRDVADELFPVGDPLEKTVRIGLRGFRVIGVLDAQGSAGGQSLDRYVWIPLVAFERTFGAASSLQVFASADEGHIVTQAEDRARASMRARRHLRPGAADAFDIVTPEASRTFVERITAQVSAAGPPIAAIALIAAIIVVTNTTLVSVSQRTREIGVRRAVGARRISIVIETLAEACVVATIGGVIGLAAATGIAHLVGTLSGVSLQVEWTVAAASLGAAGLSGIVAGWYPARRAAAIDVIDALRHE